MTQLCLDMMIGPYIRWVGRCVFSLTCLLLLLWKLVDDFVAAYQPEILAGDALQVASIALEGQDLALKLLVFILDLDESAVDLAFVLFQLVNTQEALITEDGEEQDEGDTSRRNEVHPFLEA